ncbi:hypothetical protein Pmani_040198, partial [Petrolisthes manimaculis]
MSWRTVLLSVCTWAVTVHGSPAHLAPCTFNHMCICSYSIAGATASTTAALTAAVAVPDRITELTCVGVPFARIP